MKKFVFILICLILSVVVYGQKNLTIDDQVVTEPEFKGYIATSQSESNSDLINSYLSGLIVYPARAAKCCMEGTEVIKFVVTPTGNITDIECLNSVCCDMDCEVIRALEKTDGMWKPGTKNGKPVAMEQEVAFAFSIYDTKTVPVLEHFTNRATINFNKGNKSLFEKKNPKKALKHYNEAMRYLPNDQALLYARSIVKYELNDIDGARTDLERMEKLAANGKIENNLELLTANYKEFKGYKELQKYVQK